MNDLETRIFVIPDWNEKFTINLLNRAYYIFIPSKVGNLGLPKARERA
jgi:hypothetical protein